MAKIAFLARLEACGKAFWGRSGGLCALETRFLADLSIFHFLQRVFVVGCGGVMG